MARTSFLAGVCIVMGLAPACRSASSLGGEAAAPPAAAPPGAPERPPSAAFMQDMIVHHAQAIVMTGLVAGRTTSRDIQLLAERIDVSQRQELELMARWLRLRGHQVPDTAHARAGHRHGAWPMSGMLSQEQMRELEGTRGAAFDRLFLTLMIQHHRGAIAMVERLLAAPGGSGEPEVYRLASDMDADQRAEIKRMERMLAARDSHPEGR